MAETVFSLPFLQSVFDNKNGNWLYKPFKKYLRYVDPSHPAAKASATPANPAGTAVLAYLDELNDGSASLDFAVALLHLATLGPSPSTALPQDESGYAISLIDGWSEFEDAPSQTLNAAQVRMVWCRRLAVAIWLDEREEWPWSLSEFADWQLRTLLGFQPTADHALPQLATVQNGQVFLKKQSGFLTGEVHDTNPLVPLVEAARLRAHMQSSNKWDGSAAPAAAAPLVVDWLKETHFTHGPSYYDNNDFYHDRGMPPGWVNCTYRLAAKYRRGGCWESSAFIVSTLRAMNLPAVVGKVPLGGVIDTTTPETVPINGSTTVLKTALAAPNAPGMGRQSFRNWSSGYHGTPALLCETSGPRWGQSTHHSDFLIGDFGLGFAPGASCFYDLRAFRFYWIALAQLPGGNPALSGEDSALVRVMLAVSGMVLDLDSNVVGTDFAAGLLDLPTQPTVSSLRTQVVRISTGLAFAAGWPSASINAMATLHAKSSTEAAKTASTPTATGVGPPGPSGGPPRSAGLWAGQQDSATTRAAVYAHLVMPLSSQPPSPTAPGFQYNLPSLPGWPAAPENWAVGYVYATLGAAATVGSNNADAQVAAQMVYYVYRQMIGLLDACRFGHVAPWVSDLVYAAPGTLPMPNFVFLSKGFSANGAANVFDARTFFPFGLGYVTSIGGNEVTVSSFSGTDDAIKDLALAALYWKAQTS